MAKPRADFYILPGSNPPLPFACQLGEQLWTGGQQVCLYAESEQQAEALDRLLWIFRPTSFVPHLCLPQDQGELPDVTIAWGRYQPKHRQVLLNLALAPPDCVVDFAHIAELVRDGDPTHKQAARQRYRDYQHRGFQVHTIREHA